jgi:uncharacterized protein YmfQ (DUF2313 family)
MDASAYLLQLIGLLPPGDALAREPGSVLERLLSVPAAELARVDGRVEALLLESDPARTTEMLTDWERALGLPDICYPNFQFSRASRARYFDGAGVLREAAVDEPRYLYDALGQRTEALLLEDARTNFIRNPRMLGAVVGAPGTAPTNMVRQVSGGLNLPEIVAFGSEDGIPYVDFRCTGTVASLGIFTLLFDAATAALAASGETWSGSWFWRLIAGSGPTGWQINWQEFNASAVQVAEAVVAVPAPTSQPLRTQRRFGTQVLNGGTTANVRIRARMSFPAGTHDVTLRIGLPQLERAAAPTTPMLPPAGTQAATTRAADQLYIATTQERRARILARLIERFEPTPLAIIGLATRLGSAVTLTEFRPHDVADDCEAPLLDDSWAHAFQVAGGAQQVVEFTCEDTSETPLSQWRTGAYECAIRRFAPAQTVPIFTYA